MEQNLINRKEVLDFLEEEFGFWEYIRMIAPRVGIDEAEAIELANEVRLAIRDTVESMPVIEERETTNCSCFRREYDIAPYYTTKVYLCNNCWEDIEIDADEKELKFCPHCGAKYERIVKYD